MTTLEISSSLKTYPSWPYEAIKNSVLGKSYILSLSFVGPKKAQALNQTYRKKDYIPNVLSFPLESKVGEIVICPAVAKTEAKKFNLTPDGYIAYLFIHGLVHLKGHDHSDAMDKLEEKYLKQFKIN
jgi:probable rRNA maturation factor